MKRILVFFGAVVAAGLVAGCNGSSSKDHAGRAGPGSPLVATASVTNVTPGGTFTLMETSGATNPTWTQTSGPSATFPSGNSGPSVGVSAPSSGPSGLMEFRVDEPGRTSVTVNVLFNGTPQHRAILVYFDSPAGTPDRVECTIERIDGAPITANMTVTVVYAVELSTGEKHSRTAVLQPTVPAGKLKADTSLELDNALTPIDYTALNGIIDAVFSEGGVQTQTAAMTTGPGGGSTSPYP